MPALLSLRVLSCAQSLGRAEFAYLIAQMAAAAEMMDEDTFLVPLRGWIGLTLARGDVLHCHLGPAVGHSFCPAHARAELKRKALSGAQRLRVQQPEVCLPLRAEQIRPVTRPASQTPWCVGELSLKRAGLTDREPNPGFGEDEARVLSGASTFQRHVESTLTVKFPALSGLRSCIWLLDFPPPLVLHQDDQGHLRMEVTCQGWIRSIGAF